jgi:hypothetical protein
MFEAYKIQEIRELAGLSQEEFGRLIGYTREVVNKVEKGKMKASRWFQEAVQKWVEAHPFPGISQDFPESFSHDVNIIGKASSKAYLNTRLQQKNDTSPFIVPLVGVKAQAGYMKGYEQVDYLEALEKYSLPPGVNPTGAIWRYFEIDGDSMEPTLSPSDVVLATMVPVEDWKDIKNFGVYIIHTADQLLVKRLYRKSSSDWVMISDNDEAYPQVLLPVENVRQVWMLRRHIRSTAPQPKEFRITA